MNHVPNQAVAALEFASIAASSKMLGDTLPNAVESLTAFDFDHTFADSLSVSVDSAVVDGDSAHPYYTKSIGAECSELPRAAASLAFIQHIDNPHVRPNRLRARNVVAPIAHSNLPPVLLDPLRAEFCLDVMLYSFWFVSMLFYRPDRPTDAHAQALAVGAQHYLRGLAYAYAMQLAYPVTSIAVLPAGVSMLFLDRETLDLETTAPHAGKWNMQPESENLVNQFTEMFAAAHAVGIVPKIEHIAVCRKDDVPDRTRAVPFAAIAATIGGSEIIVCPSGHSLRQAASSVVLRGATSAHVSARPKYVDPREIPDAFFCHAPIGGSHFFAGIVAPCGFDGSSAVAQAMQPVPFTVVETAMRTAAAARLPWLRQHLPTVAEAVEQSTRLSIGDQRVGEALHNSNDSAMLRAVLLAARARGVSLGTRDLSAMLLAVET